MPRRKSPLLGEQRITLREARLYFVSHPSMRTINRWHRDGYRVGPVRIKLETLREGHCVVTSREACDRFCQRVFMEATETINERG